MRPDFSLVAALTTVDRHQFALFHVELFVLVHLPFMMSVATKCFALVLLFERGLTKRQDIGHEN